MKDFDPVSAPAASAVFYRTYSRRIGGFREAWADVVDRNVKALVKLGRFTPEQARLVRAAQLKQTALPSGRWLWVGGTEWIEQPENFSGAYNCTSTNLHDIEAFGLMMDLAMMGCGTGAIIEPGVIAALPEIVNRIEVVKVFPAGTAQPQHRKEASSIEIKRQGDESSGSGYCTEARLCVGDSRQGWVAAYLYVLRLAIIHGYGADGPIRLTVDLGSVRPSGSPLKGFGGVANTIKLADLFPRMAAILNKALGRSLTALECCLLIDEAASVVVAGNVRRSAGMRQFSPHDEDAATAKDNLWQQDEAGGWRIDPARDALRMANHTLVYHQKPSLEVVTASIQKQFHSGEGAIQYAPEAIARSNRDILQTEQERQEFVLRYTTGSYDSATAYLEELAADKNISLEVDEVNSHRMLRYGLNPCGEILGSDFHCNLAEVHLNRIHHYDYQAQRDAFTAAALSAAALLHHTFIEDRYRHSRELDPIIGVSFTGLFDFFVQLFGAPWLEWWAEGRPETDAGIKFKQSEATYLNQWRGVVEKTVADYCTAHGLRVPNRCTTVQPAGTKSLLTGASPGWHPPKAQRFIRRITFRRNDPVAEACRLYGYSVIPGQSDKDGQGRLLDDADDPFCTEWLVEIPTEVSWANLPGVDQVDLSKFSALAQFDFYMQVQQHYTTHNTSATIEFREEEIEPLAQAIHDSIHEGTGYISAALLARFDANETFPRMPFEPISKARYDELVAEREARQTKKLIPDIGLLLMAIDSQKNRVEVRQEAEPAGPAGCDSDKCLMPLAKPS